MFQAHVPQFPPVERAASLQPHASGICLEIAVPFTGGARNGRGLVLAGAQHFLLGLAGM